MRVLGLMIVLVFLMFLQGVFLTEQFACGQPGTQIQLAASRPQTLLVWGGT